MMFGCVYNMSFLVGISYAIEAFTLDIRQELNYLTIINAAQGDYRTSQRLMGEFISVHAKVKQLSWFFPDYLSCKLWSWLEIKLLFCRFVADLSEIFFFVFTGCLVWCLVTICSVLCMIQLELVECLFIFWGQISRNNIWISSLVLGGWNREHVHLDKNWILLILVIWQSSSHLRKCSRYNRHIRRFWLFNLSNGLVVIPVGNKANAAVGSDEFSKASCCAILW